MKVLQINAVYGLRSTGRTTMELHKAMLEQGIESYVASTEFSNMDKNTYLIRGKLFGKIHGLLSRLTGKQAYFSPLSTRKLIRYISKTNPDIVHLRILHGNYINLKMLLKYLGKNEIATVLTLHDCWFYTGKCCHYTVQGCYKWKTACGNCPRLKKDNKSWFFDRTKTMYRDKKKLLTGISKLAVVGVSDWITNEAKLSYLAGAKIIKRIYNWLDLDTFKPAETEALRQSLHLENKLVILGVASVWTQAKGFGSFLELAKAADNDMVIVLIGRISKDIALPCNIVHIEETNNVKEMVEYYSMADVFVNLSCEETFGKVTAEALACGTPAIVINSTANPELVGEGCGYVLESCDISAFMKHIQEVQQYGKAYYSEKCIDFARANFSKNERIRDYIGLYNELTAGRGE